MIVSLFDARNEKLKMGAKECEAVRSESDFATVSEGKGRRLGKERLR